MKPSQLAALGGAAVIALAAGLWLNTPRTDDGGAGEVGSPFAPGLDAAINDVNRIRLQQDDQTLTLERDDEGWHVAEKSDYPASLERVREFLLDLAGARRIEAKTRDPARYPTLGVEAVENGGLGVTLEADNGAIEPLALILGKSARAGAATYARHSNEAGSWLVSGDLSTQIEATQWLDMLITDIAAEQVQSVLIRHADGEEVVLEKSERGQTGYTVTNLPEGESLRYESIANPIGSALAGLRLEDVSPRAALDETATERGFARFLTFDGLAVTVTTWERDGERLIAIDAAVDDEQAMRFAAAPDSGDTVAGEDGAEDAGAEADAAATPGEATGEDDGERMAAIEARAQALNATRAPWLYSIGRYKFDQLTRRMDDLVAAPAEAEGPPTTP
jgi:hypothetical protein